ncbi:MAG: Tex-like N-terminal domain-containing protein [Anaerolineales bacterium]|nr:Tex-like N-terminal domain-containing protein [Anaerolineales bacterium]
MFYYDKIALYDSRRTERLPTSCQASQVTAVINLLDEGNTVPFIARYRKEMTGSLDDEQIRIIADELLCLRGLDLDTQKRFRRPSLDLYAEILSRSI